MTPAALLRQRALARLRRAGRIGVVDAYLNELARRGDRALEVLLPYGSERVLARHKEGAAERGGLVFCTRLARRHPRRAVALLDQRLESAPRGDGILAQTARSVLPILARAVPAEAVALLSRLARLLPLSGLPVSVVVARAPR